MTRPRQRLALLAVAFAVTAFRPAGPAPFPDFDKRQPDTAARTDKQNPAQALRADVPAAKVALDPLTHSAAHVSAERGFLTRPDVGVARSGFAGARIATRQFLTRHRALFRHGPEALDAAETKREFVTPHNGLRTMVWQQHVDGIAVFEGLLVSHVTAGGELAAVSSRFLADDVRDALRGKGARPQIGAREAARLAAASLGVPVPADEVTVLGHSGTAAQRHLLRAPGLTGEASAELVWLPMNAREARLAWDVILKPRGRAEVFRVVVDAKSGALLLRRGLTAYITDASYRVFTGDSPSPFSPGHATPLTTQPATVPRALVTLGALNSNASPAGWIEDGLNETRGNNVDAHLDRDGNDAPDLPRPQGSPFRVFDFPLNLGASPVFSGGAATVQLFYWNNFMHDRLHELGFTEAAGNFQVDNFGRGGLGNDPVLADAQDGESANNANFYTPPDGQSPRMQMFLFPGPEPDRDGDLDAEVILHEYTHGLSSRRVGGGTGLSASQSMGMGEGWSDFYALALLSKPADDVDGNYAMAAYVTHLFLGLQENYYYGIRRFPYSTDLTKNPLTFRDIDPTQAGAHPGIPRSPVFGGISADEVHAQGEVWCAALWQARAALIRKHGWTNGNELILHLVIDGMNLSPANPDFLQARDAILLADEISTGGANRGDLWAAFAKRGLGFGATSPGSHTPLGVVESFELPDDLGVQPTQHFSARGPVGGPFEPASTVYTLHNFGSNALVWNAGPTANWLGFSLNGGHLASGATASVTVFLNTNASALPAGLYEDTVRFTNVHSGRVQSRLVKLRVGQPDYFTEQFTGEFDLDWTSLTFTPDGSPGFYSACRETVSGFPTDPAGGTALALGDDTFLPVFLTGTNRVSIYGHSTNALEVGSNGYLTFGPGDSDMTETMADHFNRRRVAGLFRDLHPGQGGGVSWRELDDRAAFTWQNVPEFDAGNSNSFQIELFHDGRIRLTWLNIDATFGLAGLSRGLGVPAGFDESDLSAAVACHPALALLTPAAATEGDGLLLNAGQVLLPAPRATNLTVILSASDAGNIDGPESVAIPAGQTNAFFSITVLDNAWLDGSRATIITATAPGLGSGTRAMLVHDDEAATLGLKVPALIAEGAVPTQGLVTVSAPVGADTTVFLESSDVSELVVPALATIPAGQTSAVFAITVLDDNALDGAQPVSIAASVVNWTPAVAGLVVADNEPTNLTVYFLAAQLSENAGVQPNLGAVVLPGTLSTNLNVSLASSDTTALLVPPGLTIPAGQLAAAFNVVAVNDSILDGPQLVTVTATAGGLQSGSRQLDVLDDEAPPRLSIMRSGTTVTVTWTTLAGTAYVLEGTDALNGGWTNLSGTVTATGSSLAVTNPLPAGQGFYRVVVP